MYDYIERNFRHKITQFYKCKTVKTSVAIDYKLLLLQNTTAAVDNLLIA
jgi:hypothetical protein